MRRTKTFLATFCSLAVIASCGKRGDPLPPLRPTPAGPEALSIAQIGDRIVLRWTSPVRNTDGTVEKLELDDAIVVRRVIDIDALVAEQTKVVEPTEAPAPASAPTEGEGESEGEADADRDPETEGESETETETAPPTALEPPPEAEPEPEPAPAPAPEPAASESAPAPEPSQAVPEPGQTTTGGVGAPRPALVIPPFPGEGAFITTLESSAPGVVIEYEDPVQASWIGKRVEYGVAYLNQRGRQSPYATPVAIEPEPSLAAPFDLAVESADGFVALRWSFAALSDSPASRDEEPATIGFSVYRKPEGGAYPDRPLNAEPLREPSFQDRTALFGAAICYEVRAVRTPPPPPPPPPESESESEAEAEATTVEEAGETEPSDSETVVPLAPPIANDFTIASVPSPERCLTPVDSFAPAVPADVVAVSSPSGILLTWRLVNAGDLGGYRVYRSESRDGPFEPIGEATVASFNDPGAPAGRALFYYVTAFDTAPEPNESPPSEVVLATRPPAP